MFSLYKTIKPHKKAILLRLGDVRILILFIIASGITPISSVSGEINESPVVINQKVAVFDQYGNRLDFYKDLIKNQRVAINFIYTSCTSSCPLSSIIFQNVQKRINDKQAHLISITVDPAVDNVEKLRNYAEKFHASSNWHFITGEQETINRLLNMLDAKPSNLSNHTNLVLVGNSKRQKWLRLYGLPSVENILAAIDEVR